MKIVKQIDDVEFGIVDSMDEKGIHIKKVHGDVLIVMEMVEGEPESLMTLGIAKGETNARLAFYKPMNEIEKIVSGGDGDAI